MKKILATALLALAPAAGVFADGLEVLVWQFQGNETVNRNGTQVGAFGLIGDAIDVRIAYDNGSGTTGYLNWWDGNETTPPPTFSSTPLLVTDNEDDLPVTWYADITPSAATDYAGYTFTVELGNWDETEHTWTVQAVSSTPASYDSLARHIQSWTDSAGTHSVMAWTPSYAVPEPTSGLLLVLGAAALGLRRRRNVVRG